MLNRNLRLTTATTLHPEVRRTLSRLRKRGNPPYTRIAGLWVVSDLLAAALDGLVMEGFEVSKRGKFVRITGHGGGATRRAYRLNDMRGPGCRYGGRRQCVLSRAQSENWRWAERRQKARRQRNLTPVELKVRKFSRRLKDWRTPDWEREHLREVISDLQLAA